MPTNVGVVIKADGGNEFANSMKKAAESAKQCGQALKGLESEYKGNANSLAALTAKQEQLERAQSAFTIGQIWCIVKLEPFSSNMNRIK